MRFQDLFNSLQNSINVKINKAELGRIIGLSRSGVDYNLKNNTLLDDTDVQKIETYYNVSLLGAVASDNNMVTISASCGNGVINADIDYLQLDNKQKYIYCFVNGVSMSDTLLDGDMAIVRVQDYIDKQNGIYCFTYDGQQYIKRLSSDINSLLISADNKNFEDLRLLGDDLRGVKIIGRVVGSVRRF